MNIAWQNPYGAIGAEDEYGDSTVTNKILPSIGEHKNSRAGK
jgi:hypothetical protein